MTMIERVAASIVIAQQRGLDRNGVARAAAAICAEEFLALVEARKSLYIAKRDKKTILAEDTRTEWEVINHTVEAFEWLYREIDQAIKDEA